MPALLRRMDGSAPFRGKQGLLIRRRPYCRRAVSLRLIFLTRRCTTAGINDEIALLQELVVKEDYLHRNQ